MLVTIRKNSKNVQAVILSQSMLLAANYRIAVDGNYGKNTEKIVFLFQTENDLVSDGIIGEKTWQILFLKSSEYLTNSAKKFLNEQDLINAAIHLDIEIAAMKAVYEVESHGQGFIGNFPRILFERHIFWRRLQAHGVSPNKFRTGNADILNKKSGGYTRSQEIKRLERAMKIHPQAAMESASWGLFQIMGFHWKRLGYASIESFVELMKENEKNQLDAFVAYITEFKCKQYLKFRDGMNTLDLKDTTEFARRYNGKGFRKNKYHTKILKAYLRYKK